MDTLNMILGLISIFGVIGTFYFGFKSEKLLKERNRYSWSDIHNACQVLGRYIKKRIKPDLILCFSGPSGIVANLIIESADYFIPIISIILEKAENEKIIYEITSDFTTIQTTRWKLHFPRLLMKFNHKRVCIIDDSIISGDSMKIVKDSLLKLGFKANNITTCSLICTTVAKLANKAPDKYVYLTEQTSFYLPWGKGY